MTEKALRPKDVEIRSGNKIDDAYVLKILQGKSKYPSVIKLQALAKGLGVDEDELFKVARGLPLKGRYARGGEPWPGPVLAKAIAGIVSSPEMTKAVKILLALSPEKRRRLLKIIEKEAK